MVRVWPAESRWLLAQQRQPGTPAEPVAAPQRPALQEVSQFMLLEREVEQALPNKVKTVWPTRSATRRPLVSGAGSP